MKGRSSLTQLMLLNSPLTWANKNFKASRHAMGKSEQSLLICWDVEAELTRSSWIARLGKEIFYIQSIFKTLIWSLKKVLILNPTLSENTVGTWKSQKKMLVVAVQFFKLCHGKKYFHLPLRVLQLVRQLLLPL